MDGISVKVKYDGPEVDGGSEGTICGCVVGPVVDGVRVGVFVSACKPLTKLVGKEVKGESVRLLAGCEA